MEIISILNKIGLNKKEADIYLAVLEHGPETITNIAKLSGYKRTTLYNIIEDLVQRGFLLASVRNQHNYYDAENPKKILTNLKSRQKDLEQILPDLESLRNTKYQAPQVVVYESVDAIKQVYDDVYDFVNNKDEILWVTSIADLNKYLPDVLETWMTMLREKGQKNYKVRELLFDDEAGRKYLKLLRQNKIKHPVRLLPADFPIYNDMTLYGDKAILASFHKRSFVTVIKDKEVVQTLKTLYELAWLNAK